MITETVSCVLTRIACPDCAGVYAISEVYRAEAHRLGKFQKCWTCPYCKSSRGYGESEADRLNAQINSLKNNETWLNERAERARQEAERLRKSRNAVKGVLTRVKNRIKHGVCPCCKRTFENLARHMDTKHPEFAAPVEPGTKNQEPETI